MQSFEHFDVISVVDKSIHVVVVFFFFTIVYFVYVSRKIACERRRKQAAPLASFLNATIALDQYAREKSLSTTWVREHHIISTN